MGHPKLKATIVEVPMRKNAYSYVVEVEGRGRMFLRGLGAPMPGHVGQRGSVQYTVGANFGLYSWEPEEDE